MMMDNESKLGSRSCFVSPEYILYLGLGLSRAFSGETLLEGLWW